MPILTPEERLGSTVAHRYVLHSVLGRGGMGVVFRAEHSLTGRPVALKTMATEMSDDPIIAQRFVREARAAGQLMHPNIVEVLDVGVAEDGAPFMVLELLEGEPLSTHLERKGVLSAGRALSLLLPILDALALAHARGVIHRDLKPDNVFLARVGEEVTPKLLDFGIAKVADDTASLRTRTGAVMGTPAYMSPEQARGMTNIGPAVDQWSFGVMLFEALSGKLPYTGETFPVLLGRILTSDAPALASMAPSVPAGIAAVVDRVLSRRPEDRYPDVRTLDEALRSAAAEAGIAVVSGSPRVPGVSAFPPPKVAVTKRMSTEVPTMQAVPLGPPASLELAHTSPSSAIYVSVETPRPASASATAPQMPSRRAHRRRALPIAIAVALGLGGVGAIAWASRDDSTVPQEPATTAPADEQPPAAPPLALDELPEPQSAPPPEQAPASASATTPEPMDEATSDEASVEASTAAAEPAPRRGSTRPRHRPTSSPPSAPSSPPTSPNRDPMELRGW